jgi:hypothetical protein
MTASKRKAGRPKGSTKSIKSDGPPLEGSGPVSVLDRLGVDPLLAKLIEVHGAPRFDYAPELRAAARATTARAKEAVQIELREHDVIAAA